MVLAALDLDEVCTGSSSVTVSSLWQRALQQGLARADAQALLLHALGRAVSERAWLIAHDQDRISPAVQLGFEDLVTKCLSGVPLPYLTGYQAFYGYEFLLTTDVLIPRPDTELLVDWGLACLAQGLQLRDVSKPRILDLGTGSGAVGVSMGLAWAAKGAELGVAAEAEIFLTDLSQAALAVALGNAKRLGQRVQGVQADWFTASEPAQQALLDGPFDLVVSNPPYIKVGDGHLADLWSEPQAALVSGADGLDALRTLVAHAMDRLKPGAWLLVEHGFDQAAGVQGLMQVAGFDQVQTRQDLARLDRCTGGRRSQPR